MNSHPSSRFMYMDALHWLRIHSPIVCKDPSTTTTTVELHIVFKSLEARISGGPEDDMAAPLIKSTKQSTCRVDLHDFSHQSESFQANLAQILSTFEIDHDLINPFIRKIISRGQQDIREIRWEGNLIVLPLHMRRVEFVTIGEDEDEDNDLVMRESMEEFERRNYGRVAASAVAVKTMMKVIGVGEEEVNCGVCLEEVWVKGMVLPCHHMFHSDCIMRWLKESHVCPLCRYQMPTDDD